MPKMLFSSSLAAASLHLEFVTNFWTPQYTSYWFQVFVVGFNPSVQTRKQSLSYAQPR